DVDAPAPLVDDGVEHGAEQLAFRRMDQAEPVARRSVERAALEAERLLDLPSRLDAVTRRIPVPDGMAGADQRQRLLLRLAEQPLRKSAAGRGMLHDREGDQHDDEDEPPR